MGSLTKTFGTDKQKEKEGVWIEIAVNDDDSIARIKILRAGESNKKFTKRYATLGKKTKVMRGDKQVLQNKALIEAFAETCVVEWENIENINEAPEGVTKEPYMSCSKENAMKLFQELPDLFNFIFVQASELETFQAEVNEEEGKNSPPTFPTV